MNEDNIVIEILPSKGPFIEIDESGQSYGIFTIEFYLTAISSDVFLNQNAFKSVYISFDNAYGNYDINLDSNSDTEIKDGYYVIQEGSTESFIINVQLTNEFDTITRMKLNEISYLIPNGQTSGFVPPEDFYTSYVFLPGEDHYTKTSVNVISNNLSIRSSEISRHVTLEVTAADNIKIDSNEPCEIWYQNLWSKDDVDEYFYSTALVDSDGYFLINHSSEYLYMDMYLPKKEIGVGINHLNFIDNEEKKNLPLDISMGNVNSFFSYDFFVTKDEDSVSIEKNDRTTVIIGTQQKDQVFQSFWSEVYIDPREGADELTMYGGKTYLNTVDGYQDQIFYYLDWNDSSSHIITCDPYDTITLLTPFGEWDARALAQVMDVNNGNTIEIVGTFILEIYDFHQ